MLQRAFVLLLLCACARSYGVEGSAPQPACAGPGWCWERGTPIEGVGGATQDSMYAVGASGLFLRRQGARWQRDGLPTERWLQSGWVDERGNAWAVDSEQVLWAHDGAWRSTDQRAHTVFGAGADSVWTESEAGFRQHVNGRWRETFTRPEYAARISLVVAAPDDVWSTGTESSGDMWTGVVDRFDGERWRRVDPPFVANYPVLSLHEGRVRIIDGSARQPLTFEWQDERWVEVTPAERVTGRPGSCSATATIEGETWCAGGGQIYMREGEDWIPTLDDPYDSTLGPDRWGQVPASVWAGGETRTAWGSGPEDVYRVQAGSESVLEHFDGERWRALDVPGVVDIDGTARDDVWFASGEALYHFDGSMNAIAPPWADERERVQHVHALRPGVVAVASYRRVAIYDGEWTELRETDESITDLVGTSPDDIWVIEHIICRCDRSGSGRWLHFDGEGWREGPRGGGFALARSGDAIWMLSASNTNTVQRIDRPGPSIDGEWSGARLHVVGDRHWITTPSQARSFGR